MSPQEVQQFEDRINSTVRMLLDEGDHDYIQTLSLGELTSTLANEIRFLGLYRYGDMEAERMVEAYLRTHLWQLILDTAWVKSLWPLSLQPR